MTIVKVFRAAGDFAENKDIARQMRVEELMPALERGEKVVIDFENVSLATQSFVHALISDALRKYGSAVLERIQFKKCNPAVQTLIATVCDYMQDSSHAEEVKIRNRSEAKRKSKS
jgi:hypothetical protein